MKGDDTYRVLTFNDIFNDELINNSDKYIDRILNFTCVTHHISQKYMKTSDHHQNHQTTQFTQTLICN